LVNKKTFEPAQRGGERLGNWGCGYATTSIP